MTSPGENVSPTAAPTRNVRWYMPTPGKFVALLLLYVATLYLSDQYDWFAFNRQKGWTVLIAVAVAASGLGLIVVWSAIAWLFGRRVQFGLLLLLLMVPTVAAPLGWLTREMQQATQVAEAIAQVERGGGVAPLEPNQWDDSLPSWLQNLFGNEFFGEVHKVHLRRDNQLSDAKAFRQIRELDVMSAIVVEDGDLDWLASLPQLESLTLIDSQITDHGLKKLQKVSTLKKVDIFRSKATRWGINDLEQALAGKCRVLVAGLPDDSRFLEYIGPSRPIEQVQSRPEDKHSEDSPPPPPPPVGKGIWPYTQKDSP